MSKEFDIKSFFIGEVHKNTKGHEFEIIEIHKNQKRKIKFINTGYEIVTTTKEIKSGQIRDWYAPDVCGVGVVTDKFKDKSNHYLHGRWSMMLARCYNPNCKSYKDYGALGVTVCKEWHYFPNYIKDIESLPNAHKLKGKDSKNWHIDKDIKIPGNKVYSKDTVMIISKLQNVQERNERLDYNRQVLFKKVVMMDLDGNDIKVFDSVKQACEYINPKTGRADCITRALKNKAKKAYGYTWKYFEQ